VYKARTKIKNRSVWISEDLTSRRAELAYRARRAVRDNLAVQTWTTGGSIFIKLKENGKPKKIDTEDDLPRANGSTQV
jgi:hypothetical protein